MARVISIDYGRKRTGIAVTDPLQIIAGGLATVASFKLYDFLVDYISKEDVERIVIGRPLQPNGSPSDNLAAVEAFVRRWRKHQTVPIEYYDERYTSVIAHRTMIDAGLKKTARRNKELVDEISATIILQDWMKRNGR
ncbi:MAG: Holliday junction resolvase RuvX [Prevotella sp.]|nr:Holliday junction resolvase RuvX [Prevotella sp.]